MANKKPALSRLALGALTLLLSGCASTAREGSMMLRDKEPILSEATERPTADYIGCLNPKMVAIGLPVQLMQDGSSTVLRMSRFANPVLVVEVSPNAPPPGANVQLRARFNGGWGVGPTVEAAKACL